MYLMLKHIYLWHGKPMGNGIGDSGKGGSLGRHKSDKEIRFRQDGVRESYGLNKGI